MIGSAEVLGGEGQRRVAPGLLLSVQFASPVLLGTALPTAKVGSGRDTAPWSLLLARWLQPLTGDFLPPGHQECNGHFKIILNY